MIGVLGRSADLRRVVYASAASRYADQFSSLALALYVLDVSGSANQFAAVLAASVVPRVVLGLAIGRVVDRVGQSRSVVVADGARVGIIGVALAANVGSTLTVGFVSAVVLASAVGELVAYVSFQSVVPQVVEDADVVGANAVREGAEYLSLAAAFLSAGFVYEHGSLNQVFVISAVLYCVSIYQARRIRIMNTGNIDPARPSDQDPQGSTYVWFLKQPHLLSLLVNGALTHVAFLPFFFVAVPYLMLEVFGASETEYGVARAAIIVGSLLGLPFVRVLDRRGRGVARNVNLTLAVVFVASLPVLTLLSGEVVARLESGSWFRVAYFSLLSIASFAAFSVHGVFFNSYFHKTCDPASMGRFAALKSAIFGVGGLAGYLLFGFAAETASSSLPVLIVTVGLLTKFVVHIPFVRRVTNRS